MLYRVEQSSSQAIQKSPETERVGGWIAGATNNSPQLDAQNNIDNEAQTTIFSSLNESIAPSPYIHISTTRYANTDIQMSVSNEVISPIPCSIVVTKGPLLGVKNRNNRKGAHPRLAECVACHLHCNSRFTFQQLEEINDLFWRETFQYKRRFFDKCLTINKANELNRLERPK